MKRIAGVFAASCGLACADLKSDLGLEAGEKVLLCGDSITHAHMYSHYLIAWLHLTYPELDLRIYEVARSGSSLEAWCNSQTTPPAISEFEMRAFPFEADVIFTMHGHNGGQDPGAHRESYEQLWTDWIQRDGSRVVMLGMHPSQTATDGKHAEGKADQEASFAATDGRLFSSHTFDELGPRWLANHDNVIDIQQTTATPFHGGDSVHPGPAGHIAIAWAVLRGLNAESLVSRARIDASTATVSSSENCTIANLAGDADAIRFDRIDFRLPWAIDEVGRANANALYPEIEGWQDYSIRVENLNPGRYSIACDGTTLGIATAEELAAGWNMADLTQGPVWEQGQNVLRLIREFQGYNPDTGERFPGNANSGTIGDYHDHAAHYYVNGGQRGAEFKSSMAPIIASLETKLDEVHAAAQPVARRFAITPMGAATGGGKSWTYPGVPYPDWPYDPFTHPSPERPGEWPSTAHVGFYFVAPDDPNASDVVEGGEPVDGNGKRYGFPDRPRLTLPLVSLHTNKFGPGTVIWMKGGTYRTTYGPNKDFTAELRGTPEAPCWIYGDPADKPLFEEIRISLYATEYAFVENMVWGAATGPKGGLSINRHDKNGQSHHITVRHNRVQDRNYYRHGAFFNVNAPEARTGGIDADIHDIVFYRNTFKNCGGGVDWDLVDADLHGYKVNGRWEGNRAYRIWLIEDRVELGDKPDPIDGRRKALSGNYAQIGDQNVATGNVDHVYIAGAVTEGMRQGCVGLKRCGHVVVSSNVCRNLAQAATSQGQAFNTKYDRQENQWFINNYVEHCDSFMIRGVASASGAGGADTFRPEDTRVYIIGNVFKDCLREPFNAPDASGIGGWKTKGISIQEMRGKVYIANNLVDQSVYGVYFAPLTGRQALGAEMHVYNNIATGLVAGADTSPAARNGIMVTTAGDTQFYIENNLVENGRFYFSGVQYSSPTIFNARANAAGNKLGDPLFVNPDSASYLPHAGSPVVDGGTQDYSTNSSPDVFQLFIEAFADDPDFPGDPADVWPRDWLGNTRVSGAAIDIGPYEFQDGQVPIAPQAPTGFRVE